MKSKKSFIFGAALVALLAVGCNSAPPPIQQANADQLSAMKQKRAYFDKAHGNFSALSPQDQAAYNQLAGGAAAGQSAWKIMSRNGFPQSAGGPPGRTMSPQEQAARGITQGTP